MIIKSYELKKINLINNKFLLIYGENEGFKKEAIDSIIKSSKIDKIIKYDEKQILENNEHFINSIYSGSLFEEKKIILVNRASNKILKDLEKIIDNKNLDTNIIINSGPLEKKSKLRAIFEKNRDLICVPFYADTSETLSKITFNFLKEKNINLSQSNINLIVNRCNNDRGILKNELNKIEFYSTGNKKIDNEVILKLTNLTENHSISELIDHCLSKNTKKIVTILNENNFKKEDCILIIRALLSKSKRIQKLSDEYKINNNIELTISSAKPPIFWKDKAVTKQQIYKWKPENIRQLIYKLNEIELMLKKNLENSINIVTDFMIEIALSETNNYT